MSETYFGISRVPVTRKVGNTLHTIARKHGAGFIWEDVPGSNVKGWFYGPNYGFPFDRDLANAVMGEVRQRAKSNKALAAYVDKARPAE